MSDTSCLFCNIVNGSMPSSNVFNTDKVLAFWDINPQAPIHIIVIPKIHIESLHALSDSEQQLLQSLVGGIQTIAQQFDLQEKGYRVVSNIGADGGQTVAHLHFHLLGGRALTWPPG